VLADYIRKNEFKTMVGNIKFDSVGEWTTPRVVMVQFRGIKGKDLEQFRLPGKEVIIAPAAFKSGELLPFDKARN
jgi:branched-chain amino acid transport system substrate-binding protein